MKLKFAFHERKLRFFQIFKSRGIFWQWWPVAITIFDQTAYIHEIFDPGFFLLKQTFGSLNKGLKQFRNYIYTACKIKFFRTTSKSKFHAMQKKIKNACGVINPACTMHAMSSIPLTRCLWCYFFIICITKR
jgi:hypothetical protein